jgi:hypothetical protein
VRAAILAAVVLLAGGGCAGVGDDAAHRLTAAEVEWSKRLALWQLRVETDAEGLAVVENWMVEDPEQWEGLEGGPPWEHRTIKGRLDGLRACAADLQRDVGPPPTERLEPAYALLRRACPRYAQAADRSEQRMRDRAYDVERLDRELAAAHEPIRKGVERVLAVVQARPLPERGGEVRTSRVEPLFSRVASETVGKPVEVRCWSEADWEEVARQAASLSFGSIDADRHAGFVLGANRIASLAPEVCASLVRVAYGTGGDPLENADAVDTLVHEAFHVAGVSNEAITECRAMQHVRAAARALGVSSARADGYAELLWESYDDLPDAYWSSECEDGGPLDLRPRDPLWP